MSATDGSVHNTAPEGLGAAATRYGLSEAMVDQLAAFVRLVKGDERLPAKWRDTAPKLLVDSLFALELERVRSARQVADLGTGAGFPGFALAITLPGAQITLVEPRKPVCDFLRSVIDKLELGNVEVVEGLAAEWSQGVGACDLVTTRNMGRPEKIVAWATPLLAAGGAVLIWQPQAEPSAAAAAAAAQEGLRLADVVESTWRRKRHLHLYETTRMAANPQEVRP